MSQTLKFGNGTWATKKGSTLAYNDEGGNFKPLPFTYTGAGKGTRVNKKGLIEVVENDRPRIDYLDSEDGVFLLEKAATNLVTYSEDFSQFTGGGSIVIESGYLAPDGTNSAYKVSGAGGALNMNLSLTNSETRSIYAKTISGQGNAHLCSYFGNTNNLKTITEDWQRFEVNGTTTETGVTSFYAVDFRGSTDLNEIIVWGAQVESGNLSSYIPTQGSIQTRVAETASGSGNSEVFNDSEGVLFANIAANANDGTFRVISLNSGSPLQSIRIFYRNDINKIQFYLQTNNESSYQGSVSNATDFNKLAIKYKENNTDIYINGFLVHTMISVGMPIGLSQLDFYNNNTQNFYGKTKEIAYYDTVLTDLELETLTSYRTWEAMVKELNLNVIYNG